MNELKTAEKRTMNSGLLHTVKLFTFVYFSAKLAVG